MCKIPEKYEWLTPAMEEGPKEMGKNNVLKEECKEKQRIVVKKDEIISAQEGLDRKLGFKNTAASLNPKIK